jgi:hypothetical protein
MTRRPAGRSYRPLLSRRRIAARFWFAAALLALLASAEMALSTSSVATTPGDVAGTWIVRAESSPAEGAGAEWWVLTDSGGTVAGTLTTNPLGGPSDVYATISGSASGGSVHLVATFTPKPYFYETVETYSGTLSADGKNMSGTYVLTRSGQSTTDVWSAELQPTAAVTTCTVPKLEGQTLAKAKLLIKHAGCVLGRISGPTKNREQRRVVSQTPSANRRVSAGTKVNVQLR